MDIANSYLDNYTSYLDNIDTSSLLPTNQLVQSWDDGFSIEEFIGDVIADTYGLDDVLPEDTDLLDYSTETVGLTIPFETELSQFATDDFVSSMIYESINTGTDWLVEDDSTTDHALDYSASDWLDYLTGQDNIMETIVTLTPLDEMINEQFGNDDAADAILFSNPKEITSDLITEYALDFAQKGDFEQIDVNFPDRKSVV